MTQKKQTNESDSYSSVLIIHSWLPRLEMREEELEELLYPREWAEQNGGGKEITNF